MTTITILDGTGAPQAIAKYPDNQGQNTFGSTILANGAPVTTASPMPVTDSAAETSLATIAGFSSGTLTDRSVTSTGASQAVLAANASRKFYRLQAPINAPLWYNPTGGTSSASGAGCYYIAPGNFYESDSFVSTNAVTVFCATAGLVVAACEG